MFTKLSNQSARVRQVSRMDHIICNEISDERAWATWIMVGCPDGSTIDDYRWFAENEQEYSDLVDLFNKLIKKYK